jgi:hypothetical protein
MSSPEKQFIRIFGRSGILLGTSFRYFRGKRWTTDEKRIVHFLRNFAPPFPQKMLKEGIFNKRGIIKPPRIKRFAFATRFSRWQKAFCQVRDPTKK